MLRRLENRLLRFLQRRCAHPGEMVSIDILYGSHEPLKLPYCNRCGAIRIDGANYVGEWRKPEPLLWG